MTVAIFYIVEFFAEVHDFSLCIFPLEGFPHILLSGLALGPLPKTFPNVVLNNPPSEISSSFNALILEFFFANVSSIKISFPFCELLAFKFKSQSKALIEKSLHIHFSLNQEKSPQNLIDVDLGKGTILPLTFGQWATFSPLVFLVVT